MTDLKKYANMFYNYRPCSVWSAPEVLKVPKKILDPLTTMDVYSFGLMMWELFHEQVPFDGDLAAATKYVTLEDVRPSIREETEEDDDLDDEDKESLKTCSVPIAKLIRKCWVSDPEARPNFNFIIEELMKELNFFSNESRDKDDSSSDRSDNSEISVDDENQLNLSVNN